jgi:hypothetical protein
MTKTLDDMGAADAERLSGPGGPLAIAWCKTCNKSHHHCKCQEPSWCLRSDGKLGPLPGQPGGPRSLADIVGHLRHVPAVPMRKGADN